MLKYRLLHQPKTCTIPHERVRKYGNSGMVPSKTHRCKWAQ